MLTRRQNNSTTAAAGKKNQENQENGLVGLENQRRLRNKQINAGGSLLPRLTTRTALGDIRNRAQPPPQNQKQSLPAPPLKSNGYGSQIQSRLVTKPEPRRPLRSLSGNVGDTKTINKLPPKSGEEEVSKPGPLTRAAARKSASPIEDESVKDVSMKSVDKGPTPEPQLTSEPETEAPSSSVSEDVGDLKGAAAYSTAMITNIDEGDEDNPQLLAQYVTDIYKYLRHLESAQSVREDYLRGSDVTGRMRGILVDWLAQVHVRFHLLPETFYMTVAVVDRYLQKAKVTKDHLQLVGVTGMFIASKYEEMYAPEIGDFVYITDNTFSKKQILRMEIDILRTLDCRLGRPLPIQFLRRFSKAAFADVTTHCLAKYFMELCLVEYSMAHLKPSLLAASALWLAIHLAMDDPKWSATMVHYTDYPEESLRPCVSMISKTLLKVHSGKSKLQAVKNKHATTKFSEISKHSCLEVDNLRSLDLVED